MSITKSQAASRLSAVNPKPYPTVPYGTLPYLESTAECFYCMSITEILVASRLIAVTPTLPYPYPTIPFRTLPHPSLPGADSSAATWRLSSMISERYSRTSTASSSTSLRLTDTRTWTSIAEEDEHGSRVS